MAKPLMAEKTETIRGDISHLLRRWLHARIHIRTHAQVYVLA